MKRRWCSLCMRIGTLFPLPLCLFCPGNSPGKNTGVGSLSPLQAIFPAQGSNPGSCTAGRFFTIWTTREAYRALCLYVWSLILMRTSYVSPQHSHATSTPTSTYFLPPYLFISNTLTCTILLISNTFYLSDKFSLFKFRLLKTQYHISSEWLFSSPFRHSFLLSFDQVWNRKSLLTSVVYQTFAL